MTVDGNSSLETRLRAIEESKEGEYDKRTEHLDDAGKALFINRLIDEDSPYLLQHAHNPVNWFPWGSEAFEVALAENKPVFLSIGYSTCHWCHVMEVESFDSVEVAKVLNKDFVCIKMDREQYPDIDEIYMTAVQIISGHGGWPMSNFLMPDGKPFFAATYFPPENFLQILDQITTAWQDRYSELQKSAHAVQEGVEKILRGRVQDNANPVSQEQLLQALYQREDKERGGLAGAPKFPQEPILLYLLDRAGRTGDWDAEGFISRALQHMGQGGIYDQVAGGFHRYSVDEDWLVPHFEKMLYNQSQLGLVYVQAFVLTANSFFARICRQTMDYVLRDMELPEGGYYSATDADSEGEEGSFFLWTPKQIEDALEPEQAALIADVFGVSTLGNFEGSNILQLDNSLEEWQAQQGDDFLPSLDQALAALYEVRERRIHPVRDDKRIVAWCAAMASTLLQAGLLLQEERWKASACKALDHILASNVDEDGNLSRIYLNGDTSIAAQLEDYANLIQALIVQFDVSGEIDSLDQAYRLMQKAIANYWSAAESCFYLGPREQQGPVLVRSSNAGDGAELSPVATILECLWMLEQRQALLSTPVPNAGNMDDANTPATEMRAIREAAMAALRPAVDGSPLSHTSVMRIQAAFEGGALGLIQYADGGLLRIQGQQTARAGNTRALRIQCEIAASWHLTTPENTGSAFMPLQVELSERTDGWRLVETIYPEQTETLAAEHDALKIYAGSISVALNLSAESERPGAALIKVKYQLCNESSCLLPGELTLLI